MEEEEEPAGTSRTRTDAVGFDKESENEDPPPKAGTHGRRGLGISSPASPAPPSPKYDSAALSGYLLRERRNSVSEYCQPLKLYLDVLVFLISFRNVHLMRQGWYQVRLVVEGGQQQQPVILSRRKSRFKDYDPGLNFHLSEHVGDGTEEILQTDDFSGTGIDANPTHSQAPLDKDDASKPKGHAFYSNASRIRYHWESNALDHLVKYRLEVPITSADIGEIALDFTFDLMFSPFAEDDKQSSHPRPAGPLKPVSTRKFRLRTNCDGQSSMSFNEYVCVAWDKDNFAEMDAMVHTAFTGYTTSCIDLPPLPKPCAGFLESSFGCYMTAASQQPFSIADLIEASKKGHNFRRGSSSRRRSDSDSFSAAEDEDDVKPMDHYNRVVLSLLSPLFGALDALESLRIESRMKGTSTDRHAEDLSSNDISIESNGTVADLSDVNVMNGITTTPTGSIAADHNESSPGSFSPMSASGAASTTSGTRVTFGTTVQRAVSQNAIEPAVDLIMGHLQDIPQYDQKLQFLGKLCGAISRRMISQWGYFITHYMENTNEYLACLKERWRRAMKHSFRQFVLFEDDFSRDAIHGADGGDGGAPVHRGATSMSQTEQEDAQACCTTPTNSGVARDAKTNNGIGEGGGSQMSTPMCTPRSMNVQQKRLLLHSNSNGSISQLIDMGGSARNTDENGDPNACRDSSQMDSVAPELRSFYRGQIDPVLYRKQIRNRERRCVQLAKINKESPQIFFNLQDQAFYEEIEKMPILSFQKIPGLNTADRSFDNTASPSCSRDVLSTTHAQSGNQKTATTRKTNGCPTPCHLFVFVHGLMGHASDLRTFRDALVSKVKAHERTAPRSMCRGARGARLCRAQGSNNGSSESESGCDEGVERTYHFHMSVQNQEKTFESFSAQGERLALEVTDYIDITYKGNNDMFLDRLSFVGHSMGNIVIRSAIMHPSMEKFWKHLWSYTSISGPHLGYLYSDNFFVKSGMKFLERLGDSESLAQLSMKDSPGDLQENDDGEDAHAGTPSSRQPYLQQISNHRGISLFRHVILVASQQDRYVPYHSARVEMPPSFKAKAGASKAKADVVGDMILGITGKMFVDSLFQPPGDGTATGTEITVVDVNFSGLCGLDLIGRRAHIEFLKNKSYIDTLLWTLDAVYA